MNGADRFHSAYVVIREQKLGFVDWKNLWTNVLFSFSFTPVMRELRKRCSHYHRNNLEKCSSLIFDDCPFVDEEDPMAPCALPCKGDVLFSTMHKVSHWLIGLKKDCRNDCGNGSVEEDKVVLLHKTRLSIIREKIPTVRCFNSYVYSDRLQVCAPDMI